MIRQQYHNLLTSREGETQRISIFTYVLVILQIVSVLLVAVATVMSVRSFDNFFDNTHQRIGLALYVAIWLPFIAGIFRPDR